MDGCPSGTHTYKLTHKTEYDCRFDTRIMRMYYILFEDYFYCGDDYDT